MLAHLGICSPSMKKKTSSQPNVAIGKFRQKLPHQFLLCIELDKNRLLSVINSFPAKFKSVVLGLLSHSVLAFIKERI